jgi:4-alpha-glucanotransferase
MADWWEGMPDEERKAILALPQLAPLAGRGEAFDGVVRDALLELVYGSASELLLLPFQDAFGLRDRVNVPGTVNEENWTYRVPRDLAALHADRADADRLRALAARSGRVAGG